MTLPFGPRSEEVAPDPEVAAVSLTHVIDAWHTRLDLCVSNLPWCFLPGYEGYMKQDDLALEVHTLLSNDANTRDYWRAQREHRAQCATCVRRVFCGGFFRAHQSVDPGWLSDTASSI